MNWLKDKKFKYGSAAVILTVLVILLVILFNAIVSVLANRFGWYADTSESGYSTLSDNARALLDTVDSRYNKVTICFLSDEDLLASTVYGNYILSLARQMEQRYDFIRLQFISDYTRQIFEVRDFFGLAYTDLYRELYEDQQINNGTVLIRNIATDLGADGQPVKDPAGQPVTTPHLDVLSVSDMYSVTNNSFLGELMLTGHVLGVTGSAPGAVFLTGHGEMTAEQDGTYGNADYLAELLSLAGCRVEKCAVRDLAASGARLAFLFAPKIDLTEAEEAELTTFLSGGGHLFYFADDVIATQTPAHLNRLLSSCGVEAVNAKFRDSGDAALSVDGYAMRVAYNSALSSMAALAETGRAVMVSDCRVFRTVGTPRPGVTTSALLLPAASTTPWEGSDADGVGATGREAIALLAENEAGGTLFVTGAASLASSLVYSPVYGNRDFLLTVLQTAGLDPVPLALNVTSLATDSLNITKNTSTLISVLISVLPALAVVVVGLVVCLRRHRA